MQEEIIRKLIADAYDAQKRAYAPYSGFMVGAALLASDGTVYKGCNIENVSYTPTNCAERTAFFKAVSEGAREFKAIAIVGNKEGERGGLCPPCGVCRQVMAEFCDPDHFLVIMASQDSYQIVRLGELLPFGFTGESL